MANWDMNRIQNLPIGFPVEKFHVIFDQIFVMKRCFTLITALVAFASTGFGQYREIITIAGSSAAGNYGGDGGLADSALLHGPNGVAVDPFGNVFIADFYNFRVRKVNTAGYISTFAGTGIAGYSGDNGLAPSAEIKPNGVASDSVGNIYISDNSFGVVRKVAAGTNIITTIVGWGYTGFSGDSSLAVAATLNDPRGMCMDRTGNLYIADVNNHRIRMVDVTGHIYTFAGDGLPFFGGDFGYARNASLDSPMDVACDKYNFIYIADYKNNVIRKVDTAGVITTVVGNTIPGYTGDGGAAVSATLNGPRGIAVDKNRFLYIADGNNNVIRMVDTFGVITTIAGNGTPGFSGDNGLAIGANLYFPQSVKVDTSGNVYIADADNQRIRKVFMGTSGIKNVSGSSNLTFYPNPASEYVNIAGLKTGDRVMVYNVLGAATGLGVVAQSESVQTCPLVGLPLGVYLLKVMGTDGNCKSVIRIVKA